MNQHPNDPDPKSPADPYSVNQNPHVSPDPEAMRQEAGRLHREQQRVDLIQRKILFTRIERSIYFLVGLLEVLLLLRFFLRLSGANPENGFSKFIYGFSEPFVSPFSTLFISPVERTGATLGDNIFDVNLAIAIIIYGLLAFLGIWILRYIYRQLSPTDL